MKVAIILAVFNGSKYLREQFDSIVSQEGDFSFDIFVTDDNSTDNSIDIINEFSSKYSFVKLLPSPLVGSGSASGSFFRALRQINFSRYDFVSFSDQDDVWEKDKIKRALDVMFLENTSCYFSNLTMFWDDGRSRVGLVKSMPPVKYDYIFQGGSAGCTYVLSAEVISIVLKQLNWCGLELLGKYSHDWLIYSVASSVGYSWSRDSVSKIFYRQHDKNLHGGAVGWDDLKKKMTLLGRGWYFDNLKFNLNCIVIRDDFSRLAFDYFVRRKFGFKFKLHLLPHVFSLRRRWFESCVLFVLIIFHFHPARSPINNGMNG